MYNILQAFFISCNKAKRSHNVSIVILNNNDNVESLSSTGSRTVEYKLCDIVEEFIDGILRI